MSNFFNSDGPDRQTAFSFPNGPVDLTGHAPATNAVAAGNQAVRLHPEPASLGPDQKVGQPDAQQFPEDQGLFSGSGRMGPVAPADCPMPD